MDWQKQANRLFIIAILAPFLAWSQQATQPEMLTDQQSGQATAQLDQKAIWGELAPPPYEAATELDDVPQDHALAAAIVANDIDTVKSAIAQGAAINEPLTKSMTLFLLASAYGDTALIEWLISADANPAATDQQQRNAAHFLAMRGLTEPMKLLAILAPATLDKPDRHGVTPLYYAYYNKHYPTAEFLLSQNLARLDRREEEGEPYAFRFVRQIDDMDTISHMIEYGLNVLVRNSRDQILADAALEAGNLNAELLLRSRYKAILDRYEALLLNDYEQEDLPPELKNIDEEKLEAMKDMLRERKASRESEGQSTPVSQTAAP